MSHENAEKSRDIIDKHGISSSSIRIKYLRNGFIPLPADGKAVHLKNWTSLVVDEDRIERWDKRQPTATNTGIRTGEGLVAVDIDVLDEVVAERLQSLLEKRIGGLPPLRFGRRPKRLLLLRILGNDFETFKSRSWIDDDDNPARVEILAKGSQFIAHGIHPDTGKPYEWADGVDPGNIAVADLPTISEASLREFIQMDAECEFADRGWTPALSAKRDGEPLDLELAFEQIRTRASYHEPAVAIAAHYASKGIESKEATRRLRAVFHDVPKSERDDRWHREYQDIERSIRTAYRKFENNSQPERGLSDSEFKLLFGPPLEIDDPIRDLNKRHAIVSVGGKTVVMTEGADSIAFGTEGDLRLRYKNRPWTNKRKAEIAKLTGGPQPAKLTIADAWLASPKRRDFPNGVVFRPDGDTPAGTYNLWQGWKIDGDSDASCDVFLDHLFEVICNGNQLQYDWLIGWMAHMIQWPGKKPRSAIVLRGQKGAGKDIVAVYLSRLMARSAYLNTSDQEAVWGHFNGAIANKLFIHLEEAFFSGDHRADSRIKNLITADTQTINEKHAPVFTVDSFHRLFITSNELRVVNSTEGERRYFISEVSAHRCGNKRYFDALIAEMNGDGPAALMHMLRSYDLTVWDPRPPATEALIESIASNLTGVSAWMHDSIETGRIAGADWQDWPDERVDTTFLRDAFDAWASKPANKYRGVNIDQRIFGKNLKPFLRGGRSRSGPRGERSYGYLLLDLEDARDALDKIIMKGNKL
ncbi:DUF5906 domain-containing protein [Agrobacterium vitis]|uniref:DUF5906 domain-containing protein n=1 Tax=Agrobacterium vitis TaxID=373 RepID=UPI0015728497|nr:DUF5906 domain-containing protein [Agrobacterium vitis]NSZ17554.1 bifunctional DNA primase/polymerase [Agrobacterium vitis]QZO03248.1 bifunctional DNA primase/polymerase [Agrobacterium vitis]UJL88368.1 bifunctional DNA primase/polymerase [Agrobacterium vitis]